MNAKVVALATVLALLPPIYAVLISLTPSNVAAIGGTGLVDVRCPASGCQITKVTWIREPGAPYYVTGARVIWTPAAAGTYTVYVNVYDSGNSIVGSGSATVSVSGTPGATTTEVPLSPRINPKDIYKVEVIVVEELQG